MATGTEQVGSATWNVTFQNNSRYTYLCDTHPAEMYGAFSVGTPSSSPSPTPGPTRPPTTGSTSNTGTAALTGSVGTGTATLLFSGKRPTSLKAGTYRVTITDSSAKAGFKLQRIGFAATTLTTPAFVGKRVTTLKLTAGKWKYYSSQRVASAVVFTVTAK